MPRMNCTDQLSKMPAPYKRVVVPLLLLMLSVRLGDSRVIKEKKNEGHGSDIDNPNVPKESKLENILESEAIFENDRVKKPKHLHRNDKKWQKEENNDIHNSDSSNELGYNDNGRKKRAFSASVTLWPNKTIPYRIANESFNDINKFMTVLDQAINVFSTETCIKWVPWDESVAEELGHGKYMTFRNGNGGCSASVGFSKGSINLAQDACSGLHLFLHEMGHVTGLLHEQVRSDRHQYMIMHYENIKDGFHSFFVSKDTIHDGTLDPYSVMQYGLKTFSKNSFPTIEFKDKQYEFLTTLSRPFSFYDIRELNNAYKCSDICQDPPKCQNFGFVNQNCVCRCPTGLTGTFCEKREGNCGSDINLVSGEIREIKSPGWPTLYDVNLTCSWLIHAPDNHRIKVKITDMDLAWNKDEERCYHWLEMHTNLIGEPGIKRCGKLSNLATAEYWHSVNVEAGLVLMNFDSTFANDKTPTTGFRIEVEAFKSGCLSKPCLMGSTCIEGNNDFTFTCTCNPGYSGPLCDQVEADATVICDMESDYGDNCFLVAKSYGWRLRHDYVSDGVTTYSSQGEMFAAPTTATSELVSGVTFKEGNRCLAFDYVNNGGTKVGGLTVYYKTNAGRTDILKVDTSNGSEWQTVHANISTSAGFKLYFQGENINGRTTAIDNIIVAPGFCGAPCVLVNPCKNGGKCVPTNDNLDFTCQCTNGYLGTLCETPSKDTTFTCDFEKNQPCFLTQEVSETEWNIKMGITSTSYTGPQNAVNGDIYSYINAAAAQPNDSAVYRNEYLNLPDTKRCLLFYYHMKGKTMGTLNVKLTDINGLQEILWSKSGNQFDKWFQATIDVPLVEGLNIYIEGIVGPGIQSDIAIDDVVLRPGICGCDSKPCQNNGTCTNSADLLSYTCACTSGYSGANCQLTDDATLNCDLEIDEDSCFLKQDLTDNFQWTRHQGETPTDSTGPSSAAESGQYYYYMESTHRVGHVARLHTTDTFTTRNRCLKFYYHMYGSKMGSLEVKTNTTSLFLLTGDQQNQWHYAVVPVEAENDLQLIFEGTVGNGWKSDIAIDDVVLEPKACGCDSNPCQNGGVCTENADLTYSCACTGYSGANCELTDDVTLHCDLELDEDSCFLKQDLTDDFQWTRHQGATPTDLTGPSSAAGSGQYYYFMESTYMVDKKARLNTTDTFTARDRCLKFYYHMYGSKMGSLEVKTKTKSLFLRTGDQQNQWHYAVVPVNAENDLQIIFEGTVGNGWKSDIAIDDVVLEGKACDTTKKR